jgi:FkbM family methyltransferase
VSLRLDGLQSYLSPFSARFMIRAFKARFRDQKVEFDVIQRHVNPGDTVCDIGANKGSFTYWLSRWCKKGSVVAFEPQPGLADYLAKACQTLHLHNVKVEAKGVYSRSGVRDLFVPLDYSPGASLNRNILESDNCKTVSVELVSLDDYFGKNERISLLKIDVEGAELEVLKGAERIIREKSPLLVFESENRHLEQGSVQDVFSYLKTLGYDGSFICGGKLLPICKFEPSKHQKQDGEWFWKKPDYFNNFIFSKSSN